MGIFLRLLRQDKFELIDLSENNIGNKFLSYILLRGIIYTSNLKSLNLSDTGIDGIEIIKTILVILGFFELPNYLKRISFNLQEYEQVDYTIDIATCSTFSETEEIIKMSKVNYSINELILANNRWDINPFRCLCKLPNIIPRITSYSLYAQNQSEEIKSALDRNIYINSIIDVIYSTCIQRRNSNAKGRKLKSLIKKRNSNWAFGYSYLGGSNNDNNVETSNNYYIHLNFRGKDDEFIVVFFNGVNGRYIFN